MTAPTRAFKTAAYSHLAGVGKALSSPVRLELLELLVQAPHTVEALADAVGQSVANTSHHLQGLRRAHLVRRDRRGQHAVYSVAGPDVAGLVAQLQAVAHAHVAALQLLARDHFETHDGAEPVDVHTLVDRLQAGDAVLVDVRPEREYAAGHLPGALSLPLDQLEDHLDALPRDRTVVAYCRGPFCTFSADAVKRLRSLGFDARRTPATVADAPLLEVA